MAAADHLLHDALDVAHDTRLLARGQIGEVVGDGIRQLELYGDHDVFQCGSWLSGKACACALVCSIIFKRHVFATLILQRVLQHDQVQKSPRNEGFSSVPQTVVCWTFCDEVFGIDLICS